MLTPTLLSELLMAASLSIAPAATPAADVQDVMENSQTSQTVSYEVFERETIGDVTAVPACDDSQPVNREE